MCVYAQSLQSCPTLCSLMDCSPSSVHGILQAGILELVTMPSSKGSSWPRDQTWVSHITSRFFTHWTSWEVHRTNKSRILNEYLHIFIHILPVDTWVPQFQNICHVLCICEWVRNFRKEKERKGRRNSLPTQTSRRERLTTTRNAR